MRYTLGKASSNEKHTQNPVENLLLDVYKKFLKVNRQSACLGKRIEGDHSGSDLIPKLKLSLKEFRKACMFIRPIYQESFKIFR